MTLTSKSKKKPSPKKKPARKRGKPKGTYHVKIDLNQVEALRSIQATDVELAAVLGCSLATIERRKKNKAFLDAYERGCDKGKLSIKRLLFKKAEGEGPGSVAAAIWISKQFCGMRDVTAMEHSGPDGGAINVGVTVSPLERIASKLASIAARRSASQGPLGADGSGSGGA